MYTSKRIRLKNENGVQFPRMNSVKLYAIVVDYKTESDERKARVYTDFWYPLRERAICNATHLYAEWGRENNRRFNQTSSFWGNCSKNHFTIMYYSIVKTLATAFCLLWTDLSAKFWFYTHAEIVANIVYIFRRIIGSKYLHVAYGEKDQSILQSTKTANLLPSLVRMTTSFGSQKKKGLCTFFHRVGRLLNRSMTI